MFCDICGDHASFGLLIRAHTSHLLAPFMTRFVHFPLANLRSRLGVSFIGVICPLKGKKREKELSKKLFERIDATKNTERGSL